MKINIAEKLNADEKVANEGVIFDVADDIWFRIKFAGKKNKEFNFHTDRFFKNNQYNGSKLPKRLEKGFRELFAKYCISEWEGVKFDDEVAEFNTENVLLVFESVDGLFQKCVDFAMNAENFQEEYTQEQEKEDTKS